MVWGEVRVDKGRMQGRGCNRDTKGREVTQKRSTHTNTTRGGDTDVAQQKTALSVERSHLYAASLPYHINKPTPGHRYVYLFATSSWKQYQFLLKHICPTQLLYLKRRQLKTITLNQIQKPRQTNVDMTASAKETSLHELWIGRHHALWNHFLFRPLCLFALVLRTLGFTCSLESYAGNWLRNTDTPMPHGLCKCKDSKAQWLYDQKAERTMV